MLLIEVVFLINHLINKMSEILVAETKDIQFSMIHNRDTFEKLDPVIVAQTMHQIVAVVLIEQHVANYNLS